VARRRQDRADRSKTEIDVSIERLLPSERASYADAGPAMGPHAAAVKAGERVYLSAASAWSPEAGVAALGDAAGQTHAAIDRIEAALTAAGGSLKDITKLTTCLIDRDHRKAVYEAIGRRLQGVFPVSTGLVVAGLPRPELMVQIDAEAVIGAKIERHRTFELKDWFGQNIAWQGAMVAAGPAEIFIRGQTGSSFDGKTMAGLGRRPEDAAAQAELALSNLATLLAEAGSGMDDVCKITVHISDRAYRNAVYPMIGKAFRGVHPVSTGLITPAFARPEILFEIDVQAARKVGGRPHQRIRPYHSGQVRYGTQKQPLDCDFCMAVRAGNVVTLRGQTGHGLDDVMYGPGDAAVQARKAMGNVATLLGDAGAKMTDVVKATVYVTDRAFIAGACDAVLGQLGGILPAFSAVVIKGLASPELLMEVDVTAVISET
jgi:enamine deaminase RidA (YjgF/YER057c/UK114 family)